MNIKICDISGTQIENEPKVIKADDEEYEVSDEIFELWEFAWSTLENKKALFASIKKRKQYMEKKETE